MFIYCGSHSEFINVVCVSIYSGGMKTSGKAWQKMGQCLGPNVRIFGLVPPAVNTPSLTPGSEALMNGSVSMRHPGLQELPQHPEALWVKLGVQIFPPPRLRQPLLPAHWAVSKELYKICKALFVLAIELFKDVL